MLSVVFGVFVFWQLQTLKLTKFIHVEKIAAFQIIPNALKSPESPVTSSSVNTLTGSEYTVETTQSKCTYSKNITIYMDAFKEVTNKYLREKYQEYVNRSRECDPLPGGGRCSFNHDNSSSDAILYYGGYTELKYKRVFDDQIVVVFTTEAEKGEHCHFPPPDQYDIKISYRRDATIPFPFICEGNLGLRVAEMGQPDVPVGRDKITAGIISYCWCKWRRRYIDELMKYMHIDQWGRCFRNTQGKFWKTRHGSFEEEKLKFLNKNRYKFLLAFENTVDDDYVTEKIYHAYLTRSIPIFFGTKAVYDLVPANTSLIYATNYTPKELAQLIKRVASNDTLYSEYFKSWDLVKMRKLHERYCSEYFMCATCRKVWETLYHRKCGNEAT